MYKVDVVLAAGGNPTGIVKFPDSGHRHEYRQIAQDFMAKNSEVEQFGFLEGTSHFQMSGGEFCGNAARAAALMIGELTGKKTGSFTMSGYDGTVQFIISGNTVSCAFPNFTYEVRDVEVLGTTAKLVDLGGIVHVMIPTSVPFKNERSYYERVHRDITASLGLTDRAAVGVTWQEDKEEGWVIHPVVWVKDIDSFFYESACGSGTLAALIANGFTNMDIIQPSTQPIHGEQGSDHTLLLRSQMRHLESQRH